MAAPSVAPTKVFGDYTPAPGTVDARPVLARSASNIWERTEALRSKLRGLLDTACRERKIDALVLESHPYVHPAWVKFESWIPAGDQTLTRRSSMTVTITAMPYHRFEAEYKVEWTWEGASGSVDHVHTFGGQEIDEVLDHITREREPSLAGSANAALRRKFAKRQLRQKGWQFWKPQNKVTALRPDYAKGTAQLLLALGLFGLWSISSSASAGIAPTSWLAVPGVMAVVGAVLLIWIMRTGRLVRSPGKPMGEPRNLRYLDSWQTVVFGAGNDADDLRAKILTLLSAGQLSRFVCSTERIWYWGLDGKEEREQVVLRYGRAMVFVQVYRYGADLYVGWDAQMNIGVWTEQNLKSGVERATGKRVDLKTVVHGWQVTTEYDLVDLNAVAEWTHAQVTQVLRHYLKERKIDQEIDFKIIRGERQGIGDEPKEQKSRKLFKRTA